MRVYLYLEHMCCMSARHSYALSLPRHRRVLLCNVESARHWWNSRAGVCVSFSTDCTTTSHHLPHLLARVVGALILYIVLGMLYNYCVHRATGFDACPHIDMWFELYQRASVGFIRAKHVFRHWS